MEMVVNGKGIKEQEDMSRGRGSVPGQPAAVRRPGERSPARVFGSGLERASNRQTGGGTDIVGVRRCKTDVMACECDKALEVVSEELHRLGI